MYLKHLELHGFKTFANRTHFVFDRGITAIVGPNGSGKSNIADAVRWVMGEQAYSELRVKKTEDVIFTGSATRPRMGMAEVSMTLENPDPWMPAPGDTETTEEKADPVTELLRSNPSEVTISRRAYRDGGNEYFLNGARVRLRDILELLARWGLARNTYAVIGQGLVDQALSLRPEERRALFEEAAGIGLYQSKRQNALDKLAETQQNLIRVNDIINEIAPRLPILARQAERAKNYDTLVKTLDEKLRLWYAFHWARAQQHAQEAVQREHHARETLNARRAHAQDLATQLAQLRRQGQELRAQLAEARRARTQLEQQHATHVRELAVLAERLRFTTQQLDEARAEIESLTEAKRAYEQQIAQLTQERAAKEREREQAAQRIREAENLLREQEHRAAHAETLLEESQPQIREIAKQLAALKTRLGVYEDGLRAAANLSVQADALTSLEFKRAEAERAVETTRAHLAELRAALTIAEREVANARAAEDAARRALTQLDTQIAAKTRRLDAFTREAQTVQTQHQTAQVQAEHAARHIAENDQVIAPLEARLAEIERAQSELEERETLERARLAEFEDAHNRAVLEAERARADIARLQAEIEDDLASGRIVSEIKIADEANGATRETAIVFNADLPTQLRLQLGDEIVALPVVTQVPEGLEKEIRRLRNQLKYMGAVNPNAPQEYAELKARHAFLTEQAADAQHAIEKLNQAVAELDQIMREKFQATFKAVNTEFQKFFAILFDGGTARLELTNPDDITQTGIDVIARPPGKRSAHLAMLSGGERALTATALLFAILKVSPTPFCVLDEVDAALDEANVARFRDALRTLTSDTQFIIITHNRTTMESADAVYGITMGEDGVSQAMSLRLETETGGGRQ
ncbi:MAG: chromosome segregation protein SMC [Anaerolineae bacterium]|nr:chromosome segregation protein SMC [Anaerolineae bacterium]